MRFLFLVLSPLRFLPFLRPPVPLPKPGSLPCKPGQDMAPFPGPGSLEAGSLAWKPGSHSWNPKSCPWNPWKPRSRPWKPRSLEATVPASKRGSLEARVPGSQDPWKPRLGSQGPWKRGLPGTHGSWKQGLPGS